MDAPIGDHKRTAHNSPSRQFGFCNRTAQRIYERIYGFGTESGVPDWPGTIDNHPWAGQTIVDWSIYDIFVDISTELGKSDPIEERNRGFAPHKSVVLFGKIEALDRDIDG